MASHLPLLSFLFFGHMCVVQFSILKMDGWFCRMIGICSKGQGCEALLLYGLRWLMEWRCNGVKGSWGTNAWNGMHRNGRSDRKPIWFPLTEWLVYAVWGKGVTEWNEQNNFGAWSGLSRCIVALALFCNFSTQNNMLWYASANTRKAIA